MVRNGWSGKRKFERFQVLLFNSVFYKGNKIHHSVPLPDHAAGFVPRVDHTGGVAFNEEE